MTKNVKHHFDNEKIVKTIQTQTTKFRINKNQIRRYYHSLFDFFSKIFIQIFTIMKSFRENTTKIYCFFCSHYFSKRFYRKKIRNFEIIKR